ncbi:hypothetical protein ROSINTL182_07402 [Roseburia intestinalis L1-82]|uniref:Uncharacterized protein n=1 Tax=Roseburia intestinalis L1-82 TaxID=536231 RepID=C7GBW8_9FIRM|nr:hypothetical protein ROSINTL182_07402 [Roseburia intestinalis L1-82]
MKIFQEDFYLIIRFFKFRDMKQQVSYNEWHSSVFFPLSGVRLKKESAMFNK